MLQNFYKLADKVMLYTIIIALAAMAFRFVFMPQILVPKKYSEYVAAYSKEYKVPENLVYAVIKSESGFKLDVVSVKNAKGLMQITDETGFWIAEKIHFEGFETEDLFDPETNIHFGTWYLSFLIDKYKNTETALAAYNAGSSKVSGWLLDPEYSSDKKTLFYMPYEETRQYVKRVTMYYKIYNNIY